MTRPVARSGGLLVYQLASEGSHELGFVLPKRLIRNAVQRNQLKRWTKALLHQADWSKTAPFSLVLRINTALPKATWTKQLKNQRSSELQSGRNLTRADLIKVINDTMSIKQVRA